MTSTFPTNTAVALLMFTILYHPGSEILFQLNPGYTSLSKCERVPVDFECTGCVTSRGDERDQGRINFLLVCDYFKFGNFISLTMMFHREEDRSGVL